MYNFDDSMIYHSSGISYGLWLDIRDVSDAPYEYDKGKPVGLIIDALVESGFVHGDDIKDHWREYQLFRDQDIHEFAHEVNQILGNGINVGVRGCIGGTGSTLRYLTFTDPNTVHRIGGTSIKTIGKNVSDHNDYLSPKKNLTPYFQSLHQALNEQGINHARPGHFLWADYRNAQDRKEF